jgi:hypothetical protein
MDVIWATSEATREDTITALQESGAQIIPRAGFEPLTTIAVAAGVVALCRTLRSMAKDGKYRGVIIDVTKSPVEVREMPGWDRQQVLVVSATGAQFHSFEKEEGLQELLTKLAPA